MSAILPGSTIGILGGGQLGRLMAMAARSMGYKVQVLDPDPNCPAAYVVDKVFVAGWKDEWSAENLARACDVITLEIEQVAIASLKAAQSECPVRPGPEMLAVIQNRSKQKNWLREHGFPIGDYRVCRTLEEMLEGVQALGGRCFIKNSTGGYDGRGQAKVGFLPGVDGEVEKAWHDLGQMECVAEKAQDLLEEVSVLVSRSPSGEVKVFPTALNHHENQILAWSVIPASLPESVEVAARTIAAEIAEAFGLEGLLAVEMFRTQDGQLLVNELAPRPHNSYHGSERACVTSQFEQAIRAACDLPLGDVSLVEPTAIANLLGEVWLNADGSEKSPRFDQALTVPGVRIHLYEKAKPRKGRKMGHLSAIGSTPEEARKRVLLAKSLL